MVVADQIVETLIVKVFNADEITARPFECAVRCNIAVAESTVVFDEGVGDLFRRGGATEQRIEIGLIDNLALDRRLVIVNDHALMGGFVEQRHEFFEIIDE